MSIAGIVLLVLCWAGTASVFADESSLERLLRAQVFNKMFEGFSSYHVTIESDEPQGDGSREVVAVASGRFLENTKRIKILFLIAGEQVIGGNVLEGKDLPPCGSSDSAQPSSS
ncbi:MAG: PepSY domain-containing protein [Nitrospira sp.]|nr:PepSY domain-containing protein [Nitrospira sp.]